MSETATTYTKNLDDAYKLSQDQVFAKLGTSSNGLSDAQTKSRLQADGANVLDKQKSQFFFSKFIAQIIDPMIIMLLAAAAVSAVIAIAENDSFADVIIILAVVLLNAFLGVYQENKAEEAIEALDKMAASTSRVLRNGHVITVPASEIVVGDIVILEAGDSIPADGRIIESASLQIEEAALTGESVPVNKCIDMLMCTDKSGNASDKNSNPDQTTLADRKNMAYSGTTVVYGRGKIVVCSTGMDTEIGKIAGALAVAKQQQTPLQIKMAQLSKILTWLVLGICIVVFAVQIIRSDGLTVKLAIDSFMIAVTLAVAAIPEGLPAVVTVVLSIGVTNMSKKNAIIRKLASVETLGCAQIICSDKTGTLTQNKMTVVDSKMFVESNADVDSNTVGDIKTSVNQIADDTPLAKAMALCCDAELDDKNSAIGEPTEAALVNWANTLHYSKQQLDKQHKRISEIPFDSNRKMMSVFVKGNPFEDSGENSPNNQDTITQITKGALDVILDRCTHILIEGKVVTIDKKHKQQILDANKKMADKALRVLSCAVKFNVDKDALKASQPTSHTYENNMIFVGITGMIDPVRPEVKPAIDQCKEAGITPIMITGDHVDTATAIAKELGIIHGSQRALTGAELQAMSETDFEATFKDITVYARVQPEHKTRIVKAWQNAGYVVAMTGDGVNDAPSIKNADIGIGMGITGTDVTKNVADMILADDNFASIVSAVKEGRTIYANILKSIQFLLSSNISEVLSVFFATLAGFTILKPVHLLWINLVTDAFPALALGFEKAEADIMKKPPRDNNKSVFASGMGIDTVYQGIVISALCIISWFIGLYEETGSFAIQNSSNAVTMAFITMGMVEIFHSFNMRSLRGSIFKLNRINWFCVGSAIISLLLTTVACEVPILAEIFDFTPVDLKDYAIAIGLGLCIIPIVEIVKIIERSMTKTPAKC